MATVSVIEIAPSYPEKFTDKQKGLSYSLPLSHVFEEEAHRHKRDLVIKLPQMSGLSWVRRYGTILRTIPVAIFPTESS